MKLRRGPNDGDAHWNPCDGQVGTVMPRAPGLPMPTPNEVGALYVPRDGAWWFERYTEPGEDWHLLIFGEPEALVEGERRAVWDRVKDWLFNTDDCDLGRTGK